MLYSTNTPMAYTPQPSYLDAYGYAGGTSGYNRAAANSVEGSISNTAGGVLESIPVISSFYKLGTGAYKGLKSTDTATGDAFANVFGPHHQYLANLDNTKDLAKRRKRLQFVQGADGKMTYAGNKNEINRLNKDQRKQDIKGMLSLLDFALPGIGSSVSAGIEGKQDRQKEQEKIDYNKKLQNYYQQQTGMMMPSYETKDATPYNSSITQGLMGGATGLFEQYGNGLFGGKNKSTQGSSQGQGQNTFTSMPMDTTQMVYDPNQQGDNFNWNAGTYGFTDGGVAVVGGKGNDDIALVDTNNGQDTGVRVEKGEMLVISKENVEAIEDALENGDKNSIYDIIRKQFKEEPKEMKEGNEGYAGGGWFDLNQQFAKRNYPMDLENSNINRIFNPEIETAIPQNFFDESTSGNISDLLYGQETIVDSEYPLITESLYASEVPANGNSIYDKVKSLNLGNIAGNAYDGYRFGLGLENASKELPRWTLPTDYLQYGQKLKSESEIGLSPEELALLNTTANENLRYGMENVYNLAGGNAGLALANINNLGSNRLQDAIKIASLNKTQERQNLSNYGNFLTQMNKYDRQQFLDRLNQDEKTKTAAAKLSQDAYKNMSNRADYDKTYGPNSLYAQLEQQYLKQKELETQMKQNYMNSLIK